MWKIEKLMKLKALGKQTKNLQLDLSLKTDYTRWDTVVFDGRTLALHIWGPRVNHQRCKNKQNNNKSQWKQIFNMMNEKIINVGFKPLEIWKQGNIINNFMSINI